MESAKTPLKINYVVQTSVLHVEERFIAQWQGGAGANAKFVQISQGWYVTFDGSYEAIHMGDSQPYFAEGDQVKITFERVER